MFSVQRLKVTTRSVTWSPSREPSRHLTLLCAAVFSRCAANMVSVTNVLACLQSLPVGLFLQVRLWTLSLGHSLAFASLFSKVWSVYWLCGGRTVKHNRHNSVASLLTL